jgi:hypothetical protein
MASPKRAAALRKKCLILAKTLLDRVPVRRVFRQEEELGAGRADELAYGFGFVTAEIVHDHDVSVGTRTFST